MLSWRAVEKLFSIFTVCAVLVLLAFSIVALLPADKLSTAHTTSRIQIGISTCLCIGAFLQLVKRLISITNPSKVRKGEWVHVFHAALIMAIIGLILAIVVFALSFVKGALFEKSFYFGSMIAFLCSILISPQSLAAFEPHKCQGWTRRLAYLIDRYTLALYIGAYIQIIFYESKEIVSAQGKKPTIAGIAGIAGIAAPLPGLSSNTTLTPAPVHRNVRAAAAPAEGAEGAGKEEETSSLTAAYEALMNAAYAVFVELMGLLFVCHIEQWRSHSEEPNIEKDPHDGPLQEKSLSRWKRVSVMDYLIMIFGFLCLVPMIIVAIIDGSGSIGPMEVELQTGVTQFALIIAYSLYLVIVMLYLRPFMNTDCKNVESSLDVILLRISTYGIFLFKTLIVATLACQPVISKHEHSWLTFAVYAMSVFEYWIQYAVLTHLLSMLKILHDDPEALKKLKFYGAPIFLLNALFWVYNLWQWKNVCRFPEYIKVSTMGPMWEIVETVLTPLTIFYRFHCSFLGYLLFHSKSRWLGLVFRRISSFGGKENMGKDNTHLDNTDFEKVTNGKVAQVEESPTTVVVK